MQDSLHSSTCLPSFSFTLPFLSFCLSVFLSFFLLVLLSGTKTAMKASNTSIQLQRLQANGTIDLTSNNGPIHFTDITATELFAKTSNNKIVANNVVADQKITMQSSNGRIEFTSLSAGESILLTAKNQKIKGVLDGKMSDYAITSKAINGKNSLPEHMPDGQTKLTVTATNGDIDIQFAN